MKLFLKIFSIFTPKELRYCAFLVVVMMAGAVLEAVGIGAILPLISLMGQEDFLSRHAEIADYAAKVGITTHTELIIGLSLLLILLYILKNLYLAWQMRLQIKFSISNQIEFSKELMANYLAKPYLFHLNHNTAVLLRNVNGGGGDILQYLDSCISAFDGVCHRIGYLGNARFCGSLYGDYCCRRDGRADLCTASVISAQDW